MLVIFIKTKTISNDNFVEIECAACLHTYIVNLQTISDIPDYDNNEIDRYLLCDNKSQFKMLFSNQFNKKSVYGIYPVLTKQNTSESTIDSFRNLQGTLNYDRNVFVDISRSISLHVFFIFWLEISLIDLYMFLLTMV